MAIPGSSPRNHHLCSIGGPKPRRLPNRAARRGGRDFARKLRLLELDLGADLLELRLDLVGLFLVHAFLDGLGRAFDQVLGFLEAETGRARTSLMTLIFLSPTAARITLNSVFSSAAGSGRRRRTRRHRDRGGRRNAPLSSSSLASSAASRTVRLERSSTIFCKISHLISCPVWFEPVETCAKGLTPLRSSRHRPAPRARASPRGH